MSVMCCPAPPLDQMALLDSLFASLIVHKN